MAVKKIFGKNDGTPDSPFYNFIFLLVRIWAGGKPKPQFELNGFEELEGPYILLSNHESFFDFYYLRQLPHKKKPVYVINRFYCTRPFLHFLSERVGMIPKRIFYTDMVTPVRIMRMIKKGFPVIIYPEGRLCIDGRTNRITEPGGAFYKRLGVDIVLANVNGAFYEKPKWRKTRYRTPVKITIKKIIRKEELKNLSGDEIDSIINSTVRNDATVKLMSTYPQKDKAEGLQNILYRCYACDGLYTTRGKGNTISCTSCGRTFTLDEHYRFIEEPYTIAAWYDHIEEYERKHIKDIDLTVDATAEIYPPKGKMTERAKCRLTYDSVTYESDRLKFEYPISKMQGILFTAGVHFELYHDDEQIYINPDTDPVQSVRWAHIVDIIKKDQASEAEHGE